MMGNNIPESSVNIWLENDSSNFPFDDKEDEESFRCLIRIIDEFYEYVVSLDEEHFPSFQSASYVVHTLRSGFDFFFKLYPYTRIMIETNKETISDEALDFKKFVIIYKQRRFRDCPILHIIS